MIGALAVQLLCCVISGQSRWIVDAIGGPGFHFKDLPPAFAVATHGDTIVVRNGTYRSSPVGQPVTTLSQGVTILGATSTIVQGPLRIAGVPTGRRLSLCGVTMIDDRPNNPGPLLRIQQNGGFVHIERVTLQASTWTLPAGVVGAGGIDIDQSSMVSITACAVAGGWPAVDVDNSEVTIASGQLDGSAGSANVLGQLLPGGEGVVVRSGNVYLSRCLASGGDGFIDPVSSTVLPPLPAVSQVGGELVLVGDANTVFAAGLGPQPPAGTVALLAQSGRMILTPEVVLLPAGGAAAIGGPAGVIVRSQPSLTGLGAPPGGTALLDLFDQVGASAALVIAAPAVAPVSTPFGSFWLDPSSAFTVPVGVVGVTRHLTIAVPVPNFPSAAGAVLAIQGGTAGAAGARLSNPLMTGLF